MNLPYMKSAVASWLCLSLASPSLRSEDEVYPPTPEGIRRFLDTEYPEAPEDLVTQYVDTVKKTRVYRLTRAVETEAVRSLVTERLEPFGLEFDVSETRSLEAFEDINPLEKIGVHRRSVELPDGDGVRLWILYDNRPGSPQAKRYRVAPSRLREIDFRYVYRVFIHDPFHAALDRFTATDSTLGDVVKQLAEYGDADLVLREGDPRVTLDVRNRSISECLALATSIADYELGLEPGAPRGRSLDVLHVLEEHGRPAFLRELIGEEEAPESPLDALGEAISRDARSVKERRPIIQVKPPARKVER